MGIPRNSIYRERVIKITARDAAIREVVPPFTLTEVVSVRAASAADTAISGGLVRPVVQPWYFKPFTIDIVGRSYIGAFSESFLPLNLGVDDDIAKLLKLQLAVNSKFFTTDVENNVQFLIEYHDPRVPISNDNLHISQSYIAVFDNITVEELDTRGFVKNYSIKFTGKLRATISVETGAKNAKTDKKSVKKHETGGVKKVTDSVRTKSEVPSLASTSAPAPQSLNATTATSRQVFPATSDFTRSQFDNQDAAAGLGLSSGGVAI